MANYEIFCLIKISLVLRSPYLSVISTNYLGKSCNCHLSVSTYLYFHFNTLFLHPIDISDNLTRKYHKQEYLIIIELAAKCNIKNFFSSIKIQNHFYLFK